MDELEQLLRSVPPQKRDTLRAHWRAEAARGVQFEDWARAVRQKYPDTVGAVAATPSDATQVALAPMAGTPASIGADQGGARIPLPRAPGRVESALLATGNAIIPFADEAVAALHTGDVSGPAYETARRLAEYKIGQAAREHPILAGLGTAAGSTLVGSLLLGASPEALATRGTGALLGRGAAEGAALGGLYGAGASDPDNRLRGAVVGGVTGAALSPAALGLSRFVKTGSPAARMALNVAEAGDADIGAAGTRLFEAHPESPLMAADVLGPVAQSRVRAVAAVPGPGQRILGEALATREAGRPQRLQGVLEDALGATGINPYQAADQLAEARTAEANRLYEAAYQQPLSAQGKRLAQVPTVKSILTRLRTARTNAGEVAPRGPMTMEELHSIRKILDDQTTALTSPSASSADKEAAFVTRGLRDRVDAALKTHPAFARADAAFTNASRLMRAYTETGTRALQLDPADLDYRLSQMGPDEQRMVRLGLPASSERAIQSGSARSALQKLGVGQGGRLGRKAALERILPRNVAYQFGQATADEELMRASEQAGTFGSPTAPAQQSILESLRSGGSMMGTMRRSLARSVLSGPNPDQLANEARMLTVGGADRPALSQLLADAATVRTNRGQAATAATRLGRSLTTALPTIGRTAEVADRSMEVDHQQEAEQYMADLRAAGATPERALALTRQRFGL